MSYLLLGIRLLLLGISLLGIACFLYDKTKANPAFLPLMTIGAVTVTMYVAGLVNELDGGVLVITLAGVIAAVYYALQSLRGRFSLRSLLCVGTVFFAVASLVLFVLLRGVYYDHYDNFSHWGLIVKEMFRTHSYPTDATGVTFANYLPGTATFIYYVCSIIGYCESYTLMAQGLMVIACVATLFFRNTVKRPLSLLAMTAVAVVSLTFPNYCTGWHLRDLLVDGLLGYLTVAAVMMIVEYRQDCQRAFFCLLPTFLLLTLVKDSGKILMFICFVLLLITAERAMWKRPRALVGTASLVVLPLLTSRLWKRYILKAYPAMAFEDNKFAFTEEKISELIEARPDGFFEKLPNEILTRAFVPNSFLTQTLIAVSAFSAVALIWLLIARKKVKLLVGAIAFCAAFLGIYLVMLGVLYGALFTPEEAVTFDSFSRYLNTPYLVIVTLLSAAMVHSIATAEFRRPSVSQYAALISAIVLTVIGWPGIRYSLRPMPGESERRAGVRAAYEDGRDILDGKSRPLVYIHTRTDTGYLWFASLYENWQAPPNFMKQDQVKDLSMLNNADVLLIAFGQEDLLDSLQEKGVTVVGSSESYAYRIDKTDGNISLISVR